MRIWDENNRLWNCSTKNSCFIVNLECSPFIPSFKGTYILENEDMVDVSYYYNGMPHREDGPARTFFNKEDKTYKEEWYFYGKIHRNPHEGPAILFKTPAYSLKKYCVNNKEFPSDSEAIEYWNKLYG